MAFSTNPTSALPIPRKQLLLGVRSGVMVALLHVAPFLAQEVTQLLCLYPFRHDHDIQAVRHGDDRAHDRVVFAAILDIAQEGTVDLELVRLEYADIAERGVAGS